MFENNIFDEYLEEESKRVLKKLKDNEVLTQDDKLIMILKSQTNHFHHLDVELREEIRDIKSDIKDLREDMKAETKAIREDMKQEITAIINDMDKNNKSLREDMKAETKAIREDMDKRFQAITLRMDRFMVWSLGLTLSSTIFIIGFMVTYFQK